MMRPIPSLLMAAVLAVLPAHAWAETKAVLDTVQDESLLKTRFLRFGPIPNVSKSILLEGNAVRFQLPPMKDAGHSGLLSVVVLAGDFEITANYTWKGVLKPKVGYGSSCGIALDTKGPAGSISLSRATLPGKSAGYLVTRGTPTPNGGMRYDDEIHVPTEAMSGRLALRREKKELVCLAASGEKKDLFELIRLPFTDATVREVRIYGDPGGSETGLDARIYNFRVTAEEITAGTPNRDRVGGIEWWVYVIGAIACGGAWVLWRRRQKAKSH